MDNLYLQVCVIVWGVVVAYQLGFILTELKAIKSVLGGR